MRQLDRSELEKLIEAAEPAQAEISIYRYGSTACN